MTDHHLHVAAAFGATPSHIVAAVMPDIDPGVLAASTSGLPDMVDPAAHTSPETLDHYQSLIESHAAAIAPVQHATIALVDPTKAASDVSHHHNHRRRDSH